MRRLMLSTENGTVAHELTDGSITIGRSPENMIVLEDPSVSSRHAELQAIGDDYQLTDRDSTNGTRVNGEAITSVLLRAGDRIRIGKVEGCFECKSAEEAQPLPVVEALDAELAEESARPVDFANASPFPRGKAQKDPIRTAAYAIAVLAILAFLASMAALAQMQAMP